jgi:signal transduction histidine kinase
LAKNKNGSTFQALVHFNQIKHSGNIEGLRGIAVDISENKRTENALLLYQEKLRSLTKELLLTEERERRRIASELHDRIGHALTNVSIKTNLLKSKVDGQDKNLILKDINILIEQSIQDVQSLIFEISPPILYDIGLVAAIDWLIEQVSKEHGISIEFKYDDILKPVNDSFRVLIFRAVQELLFNVVKHADATHVEVSITEQDGNLLISIQDDGIGMPARFEIGQFKAEGFGHFSIKERLSHLNGRLIIESKPSKGTRILMEIPNA